MKTIFSIISNEVFKVADKSIEKEESKEGELEKPRPKSGMKRFRIDFAYS